MASEAGRQSRVLPAAIVGLCLVVGLALAGYFVSRAAYVRRLRAEPPPALIAVEGTADLANGRVQAREDPGFEPPAASRGAAASEASSGRSSRGRTPGGGSR